MAGLLKLLLAEEQASKKDEETNAWQSGGGKKGGGKKGGGKGAAKGGANPGKFVNPDGSEQSRCWQFDDEGHCEKIAQGKVCYFAHVDWTTGENRNPRAPWSDGGGKGSGGGKGPNAGGKGVQQSQQQQQQQAAGATTATGGRRVVGKPKPKNSGEGDESDAARIRREVQGVVFDSEGLLEEGKGVELAIVTDLTTASEMLEENENGENVNIVITVEKEVAASVMRIRDFLKTKAKRGGVTLGAAGVKKIEEAMVKMFLDQDMRPETTNRITEKGLTLGEDKDPLERALAGIGTMISKSVADAISAGQGSGGGGAAAGRSPQRKKRRNYSSPVKKTLAFAAAEEKKKDERRKRLEEIKKRLEESEGETTEGEEEETPWKRLPRRQRRRRRTARWSWWGKPRR